MRVAAKQYLPPTVGVEFHGKIPLLFIYRFQYKSPVVHQFPTAPISRRFRQPTATPTQPLSAARPHGLEQVAVLKIIDYIRNAEFLALP